MAWCGEPRARLVSHAQIPTPFICVLEYKLVICGYGLKMSTCKEPCVVIVPTIIIDLFTGLQRLLVVATKMHGSLSTLIVAPKFMNEWENL